MKKTASGKDFHNGIEKLLHIKPANTIKDPLFQVLQGLFDGYLSNGLYMIPRAENAEPARLATGVFVGIPTWGFRQFSAVGPLLKINEDHNHLALEDPPKGRPIMIATDVVVERFDVESDESRGNLHARVLHTSRGPLNLRGGKTNVILATGAIPATTILMNSIGDQLQDRAGQRLTAHFRSNIKARFRVNKAWLKSEALPSHPVIAACHVRGHGSSNLQWHVQVNGIHQPGVLDQETNLTEFQLREFALKDSVQFGNLAPDYEAALSAEQWYGSEGYVIVCTSRALNRSIMQN
jgi:hypothetical protein